MRINSPVTGREITLRDDSLIVSKTDLKGQITYVNKDFIEASGFTERELIGQPHNILRHPDMPQAAFKDLWETVKAGRPWRGLVKNRTKSGDHYWVEATATPIKEGGRVVGYMSVRIKADRSKVAAAEALYRDLNEGRATLDKKAGFNERFSLAGRLALLSAGSVGLLQLLFALVLGGKLESVLGFEDFLMLGVSAVIFLAAIAGLVYWLVQRNIAAPITAVLDSLDQIAQGNYRSNADISRNDEIGKLQQGLVAMQTRLGFEVTETNRVASESLRLKIGLDNVATNVMLGNADFEIIYMNQSLERMFEVAENDIRRDLPNFDRTRLIGSNIDVFHKNPAHQRGMLARLNGTHKAQVVLGGRTFSLTVTPVIDPTGHRLGYAVEWFDRTNEVRIESEIANVIQSAEQGNLEARLDTNGLEGFFMTLGRGINGLLESNGRVMQDLGAAFRRLSEGDLTTTIEQRYVGGLAETVNNANSTIDSLREIIRSIQGATDAINTAAQEIASGNQDLSARTEEQASSLEQTASSMEQLTSTVKQNADSARSANELADNAQEVAERGGSVVSQVVETMSAIHQSSSKIADIIGVIDGIAFQTNILALNAAVEAARAGEQGRGFAVVATEVRNLAQRSAGAAKEIKTLISDSVEKVQVGSRLVDTAGQTMEEVVESIKRVAKLMSDIANASREQSSGIEQVGLAVGQMDEVTQQNAALVEEAAAAAESLEEQARSLQESVAIFRLPESGGGAGGRGQVYNQAPVAVSMHSPRRPSRALPSPASSQMDDEWQEF
jgi:methyl-accepting chemotaxis protein